ALIGSLGCLNLSVGLPTSGFGPAVTIQEVAGLLFGGWGILAAALMPGIPAWVAGSGWPERGPAALIQGGLARLYCQRHRLGPDPRTARDVRGFLLVASLGSCALDTVWSVGYQALAASVPRPVGDWATWAVYWFSIRAVCSAGFGVPLLRGLGPLI